MNHVVDFKSSRRHSLRSPQLAFKPKKLFPTFPSKKALLKKWKWNVMDFEKHFSSENFQVRKANKFFLRQNKTKQCSAVLRRAIRNEPQTINGQMTTPCCKWRRNFISMLFMLKNMIFLSISHPTIYDSKSAWFESPLINSLFILMWHECTLNYPLTLFDNFSR